MEPQSHTSDEGTRDTIPSTVEKPTSQNTSQNAMKTAGDGGSSQPQSRGTSTAEEVPGRDDVTMPLLQEEAEDQYETGNRKPNTRVSSSPALGLRCLAGIMHGVVLFLKSSKRSERFEEEICKTKKRLEEASSAFILTNH